MLRNERGITLVALVVTIVVLIILATISISVALNGGLLDTADEAAKHQANALAYDDEFSVNTSMYVNDLIENATYVEPTT